MTSTSQKPEQTWEISDIDGSNKRRVTLGQYRAEVEAAKARAEAIFAASVRSIGMTRHTYGFSFSPSRALGIAGAKGRLSREIGVPLTQGGRERKLGRLVGQSLGWLLLVAILGLASLFGIGR